MKEGTIVDATIIAAPQSTMHGHAGIKAMRDGALKDLRTCGLADADRAREGMHSRACLYPGVAGAGAGCA